MANPNNLCDSGMAVPVTIGSSIIFQTSILLVKKIHSRNGLYNYIKDLRALMVEGVTNVFSMAIALFTCVCGFAWVVAHVVMIWENEEDLEPTASILPAGIVWMMILLSGVIAAPFLTRHALRSAATCWATIVSNIGQKRSASRPVGPLLI